MPSPKRSSANRLKFTREPLDIDDLMNASSFSGIRDVIESHFGRPDGPAGALQAIETDPTRLQFLWKPEQATASVRLCADLIELLERESIRMFRAITERGSEIGGVLLGHVLSRNPLSVIVEDYEPVECAYTLGSNFALSGDELSALRETVARHKEAGGLTVVGFFRSNVRPACALREEDLSMFDSLFPEEHNIFVLAKPYTRKPSQGAIFIREQGRIRSEASYLEFPFSKAELERIEALQPGLRMIRVAEPPASTGEPIPDAILEAPPEPPVSSSEPELAAVETEPAPVTDFANAVPPAAPEAEIEPSAETFAPPPPASVESAPSDPEPVAAQDFAGFAFGSAPEPSGSSRWVIALVAVVILLAGAGFLVFTYSHDASSARPVAAQPAPTLVPSVAPPAQASIELRAEVSEAGVTVRWDATQPEVSSASHGKIAFQDGGVPTTVELSAADLKKGAYTYKPNANDLTIRFESGPSTFGSIRVLGATRFKKVADPKNAPGHPR